MSSYLCKALVLLWQTGEPLENSSCESPLFNFIIPELRLKFFYTGTSDPCYYLVVVGFSTIRSCAVTVYLQDEKNGNKPLFLQRKNISWEDGLLWEIHKKSLLRKMPSFEKSFSFVCMFEDLSDMAVMMNVKIAEAESESCLNHLSNDFGKLLESGSNHDVELKCSDLAIKAHRIVLSSRSEVFGAMLNSDMVEGRTGVVEVKDMDAVNFSEFIRYLYTGSLDELTVEKAKVLYKAGHKYSVLGLVKRCARFLLQNLTLDNACECLAFADAYSDQELKDGVMSYMLENNLPLDDERWLPSCDGHPRVANEALNRFFKAQNKTSFKS